MFKNNNEIKIVFAGGGTGGHIYPGLAVADSFREICKKNNKVVEIYWIGNSSGMDSSIVEKNVDENGVRSADFFYGIPSGKLRRYFSIKNFFDLFKILAGFIASFFILLKIKPDVLFSKGGFVSVTPCICAKILHIPVYTHECDYTPGLATKINSKSAKKILISYSDTAKFLNSASKEKVIVTGNPVRPSFYCAKKEKGLEFLCIKDNRKPILLVLGGSLGARQINLLIKDNLEWLCERFIVVHQTGNKNIDEVSFEGFSENVKNSYKPYSFIYNQMPDVISCCDVVVSRAGANSIWECAVLRKPMILIPLCGAGTRGDQEDNAEYFEKAGAAIVLSRNNSTSEHLKESLEKLLDESVRLKFHDNINKFITENKPAEKIAELLYNEINIAE